MNKPGRLLQNVQAASPPLLIHKSVKMCLTESVTEQIMLVNFERFSGNDPEEVSGMNWNGQHYSSPPLASTSNKACLLPTSVGEQATEGHKRTGIRGRELEKVERQEQRGGENTSMHDNEDSIQLAAVHGLWWWLPKTGGRSRSLTDSSKRRAVEDRMNRAGSVTILLTVRTGTECKTVQVCRMVIGWMS